jgi:hypothetical protein
MAAIRLGIGERYVLLGQQETEKVLRSSRFEFSCILSR